MQYSVALSCCKAEVRDAIRLYTSEKSLSSPPKFCDSRVAIRAKYADNRAARIAKKIVWDENNFAKFAAAHSTLHAATVDAVNVITFASYDLPAHCNQDEERLSKMDTVFKCVDWTNALCSMQLHLGECTADRFATSLFTAALKADERRANLQSCYLYKCCSTSRVPSFRHV